MQRSGSSRCRTVSLVVLSVLLATPAWAVGTHSDKSGPIQITADGAHVWWVNPDHDAVSRYDTATADTSTFSLPVLPDVDAHRPGGLDVADDGSEVWVAGSASDRLFVLDGPTGGVLSTIELPTGASPTSVVFAPNGATVWVVLNQRAEVRVYDAVTRAPVATIPGFHRRPFGLAFSPDDPTAWVTHDRADGEDSHVTGIDVASHRIVSHLLLKSVEPKSPGPISGDPVPVPEGGYLLLLGHLAGQPGAHRMWLPVQYQNFHNPQFTPDSTIQSALHRIDTESLQQASSERVVLSAVFAHDQFTLLGDGWDATVSGPIDIAFDTTGDTAYVLQAHSGEVVVYPTDAGRFRPPGAPALTEIRVGEHPIGLVASPTDSTLYVLNRLSRDVSVIDTELLVETTRLAAVVGVPEPFSPEFLAGARLFHGSNDPRLSSNEKVACASCHPNGGSDGVFWEFSPFGAGHRKSFSLLGLSHSFGPPVGGRGQLHRSGDRDEVQDFEFTARSSLMGGTGFLASPNPPLGASNAGLDPDLDAIATYLLGLPAVERSPHRAADGALVEAARRGALIFQGAAATPTGSGCVSCHVDPDFTDRDFHDIGGFAPSPEGEGPLFNTPSLIGMWDRDPHVQATGWQYGPDLAGVVEDARSGGHGNTSQLDASQRADLTAFLRSIDGELADTGLTGIGDTSAPIILAVRPLSDSAVQVIFDESVDPVTAENPANYVFTDGTTTTAATQAVLDDDAGNRVRVSVSVPYPGCAVQYTLLPGAIEDIAASYGEPANHVLDPADPRHQLTFTMDGTITVTFGSRDGTESLPGVARVSAFNPSLGNVSHNAWRLNPSTTPEVKGFVAFDFIDPLTFECGVTDASRIVDVAFSGPPYTGAIATLELRRCLMPWDEPPTDWCFGCGGALTRQNSTHPSIPWHQPGAGAVGGSGTEPSEYYPTGAFDTAAVVDATVAVDDLGAPASFASPSITDAFRFWYDHPTLNHGYAVEILDGSGTNLVFEGSDEFTLSVTFTVPVTGPGCGPASDFVRGDCNGDGNDDIADVIAYLAYLFEGTASLTCADACDGNDDGVLDLADAIAMLGVLFSGDARPAPAIACGADPTPDGLGCGSFPSCD